MSNPFAETEAWEVSTGTYLGPGNYVVNIDTAEDASTKKGEPQIHVMLSNSQGTIQDWVFYRADFLSKVAALYDAAGVDRPGEGEFDPSDNCRISQKSLDKLWNKQVGIVVRPEEYQGKTSNRVQGYLPASEIDGAPDARGLPDPGQSAAKTAEQKKLDDVPF